MRSTNEPSNEEPRRRKTLEAAGLRLTPEQLESVRVDIEAVSSKTGVDPKTVQRWLDGRVPYARHRWAISAPMNSSFLPVIANMYPYSARSPAYFCHSSPAHLSHSGPLP